MILGCGIALWLLKANAPAPTTVSNTAQPVQQQPKSQLPSRPEESWSYIRDLETRTVITDNNQTSQERLAQLTAQQKQQIEERRKQEEARLAEQVQQNSTVETPAETTDKTTQEPQLSDEALATKRAEEEALAQKRAEEKRKQAELKKQQEAKKAEQAKLAEEKVKKSNRLKLLQVRQHRQIKRQIKQVNSVYNVGHLKIKLKQKICKHALLWQDLMLELPAVQIGIVFLLVRLAIEQQLQEHSQMLVA